MQRRNLRGHKAAKKILASPLVSFGKGHKLPAPLNEVVRSKNRTETTKLIPVSDGHYVCFLWRDGPARIKSAFYGWLLHQEESGRYIALAALHYHPSHKPVHMVVPCDKPEDEDQKALGKGCAELSLDYSIFDPREELDRHKLIERFCTATGIEIVNGENYDAPASQSLDLRPL